MIYLAGPMTAIPDCNRPVFNAAAKALRSHYGDIVFNPAALRPDREWEWYMRVGLSLLLDCTEVVVLPGWRASRGARLEVAVAKAIGLPVTSLGEALG